MDIRSEVMSRAGELREQGLDSSEALSQAWEEAGSNPRETKFEASTFTWLLLLGGGGLVIYYLVKKQWPWQGGMSRRLLEAKARAAKNPGRELTWGERAAKTDSPPVLSIPEAVEQPEPRSVGGGVQTLTHGSTMISPGKSIAPAPEEIQPVYIITP